MTTLYQAVDLGHTVLTAPYTPGDTTITVANGSGFASASTSSPIPVTVFTGSSPSTGTVKTVLAVTARASNTLTVTHISGYNDLAAVSGTAVKNTAIKEFPNNLANAINANTTAVTANATAIATANTAIATANTNIAANATAIAAKGLTVGNAVASGTPTAVLYADGGGLLGSDVHFTYSGGTLGITVPEGVAAPCVELRPSAASAPFAWRMKTPQDAEGEWTTYISQGGTIYCCTNIIASGHKTGLGAGSYRIHPPVDPMPTVLEVNLQAWADDNAALCVRGNDAAVGVHNTAHIVGINDAKNAFSWGILEDGSIHWCDTQACDANPLPVWDTNFYRLAAGSLKTDGILTVGGDFHAGAGGLTYTNGCLTVVNDGTHNEFASTGGPFGTSGFGFGQIYLNAGKMTLYHEGTGGVIQNNIGNLFLINTATNGGMYYFTKNLVRFSIDPGGHCGVNTGVNIPVAQLEVDPLTAATVGLAVVGAASQTADLQQWQNSGNTVLSRVDPSGNLGINIVPTAPLHVAAGGNIVAILTGSSTSDTTLEIINTSSGGRNWGLLSGGSTPTGGVGPGQFGLRDASAGIVRMLVDTSGKFGINTSTINAQFHIGTNAVGTKGLIIQATSGQTASLQEWQDSTGAVLSKVDKSGAIASGHSTTGARPTVSTVGAQWYDTTLGIPIWWSGTNWTNASGATV